MKKSIAVICLFSLLIFSACVKDKGKITVADSGYTCDAIIDYGENFSLKATIKALGGGMFSLLVNEPENISGLTFSFDNSDMKISYNGTDMENNLYSGYGGFAEILNEIFLKFTTSNLTVSGENNEYIYDSKTPKYSFRVVFNKQGFPKTITVDEAKLKAAFSNWKY